MIQLYYKINIENREVKKMYKVIDSWIEYIHPKLGCIEIARIWESEDIIKKGYKIIKKVINGEIMPIEA